MHYYSSRLNSIGPRVTLRRIEMVIALKLIKIIAKSRRGLRYGFKQFSEIKILAPILATSKKE